MPPEAPLPAPLSNGPEIQADEPADDSRWVREWLLPVGLIVVATAAAYIPAMRAGYVWDDKLLLFQNPLIRARDGLYRFWFTADAPDYFPLTSTDWWLEWRVWRGDPAPYHVGNILLHALAAVLLWRVVARLKAPGALLAGLVFAVHPVTVASVAWIAERKNNLSMVLYLLSLLAYLRFEHRPQAKWYALALAAFLATLLAKTSLVMLPAVLLLLAWWQRGRVSRKDVLRSVPFFALSLALGLLTIWFQQQRAIGEEVVRPEGLASRIAASGWIAWFYLYKIFVPVGLVMIYPRWDVDGGRIVSFVPLALLLGVLAAAWAFRRSWGRNLLAGLGYFLLTLLPVMGFVNMSFMAYSLVADHLQYAAIIGIIALASGCAAALTRRLGLHRAAALAAGAALVAGLGALTWRQSQTYHDTETFYRTIIQRNGRCWLAYNNLGVVLVKAGKPKEAIECIQEALRLKPDYGSAQYNMGNALAASGESRKAIPHYEQCLRLNPKDPDAHYYLGNALSRLGRVNEAIEHYKEAVRLRPNYTDARNNLGNALASAGEFPEAIEQYEQCLRSNPDDAEVHNNMGLALARVGDNRRAAEHFEKAIELNGKYADAHANLAWQLATRPRARGGDPYRALALAQWACELTGNGSAKYMDILAAAYAANRQFPEAIETALKAIQLPDSARDVQLTAQIEARLELYRAGRPYLEPAQPVTGAGP